jgi:hypothetical protein
MSPSWRLFVRFWQDEASLSVLLLLLVLSELVLPAVAPVRSSRDPLIGVFLSSVLLAGAAAVWHRRQWAAKLVAVFCLIALPLWWIARASPAGPMAAWRPLMTAVVLLLLALMVLSAVLRAGTVTRHQIQGAIAAYLLIGLAWAAAYEFVALRDAGAFAGTEALAGVPWTYYSLVTLTTMGYGDITPVSSAARSLAVAEALTGQMYIAILIARLVALSLQARGEP